MAFTDENLKRLKYEFEPYVLGDPRILTGEDWEGLIARLEAAEEVCRAMETFHWGEARKECGCSLCDILDVWRKSKGVL